jgi:hypothetical protein
VLPICGQSMIIWHMENLSAGVSMVDSIGLVCMDESDAFRLQHDKKVSFFDCHRRYIPLSHEFRGDKESFQKKQER